MPALSEEYSVSSLGILGPCATGKARPSSILRVLVEFDQAPGLFRFVRLKRELPESAGVKVDLVPKSTLRPELGKQVMKKLVDV